ncbi:DNA-formamidopyrimidine glycosylase [soil metagenome]
MPELPEVETIRLFLSKNLIGKTITQIDIREPKQFHGDQNEVIGKKITNVGRTGKILHIKIDPLYLSFHLKLSGQILYANHKDNPTFKNVIPRANSNKMPSSTTRVIFYFDDNSALYFNDMRKFGWVKLSEKPEEPKAVDILSPAFTLDYFTKAITGVRRPIKVVLLDQDKMAGIGNIYANDSLWEARIHPARKANTLSVDETKILYEAILKIINEGVKYRGSSAADELYVLPDSEKGQYQHHFKTYYQHGKPCKRCGELIVRTVVGGRGTFYCPKCQSENPQLFV